MVKGIRQNDADKCNAKNGQGKLSEIIKEKKILKGGDDDLGRLC